MSAEKPIKNKQRRKFRRANRSLLHKTCFPRSNCPYRKLRLVHFSPGRNPCNNAPGCWRNYNSPATGSASCARRNALELTIVTAALSGIASTFTKVRTLPSECGISSPEGINTILRETMRRRHACRRSSPRTCGRGTLLNRSKANEGTYDNYEPFPKKI